MMNEELIFIIQNECKIQYQNDKSPKTSIVSRNLAVKLLLIYETSSTTPKMATQRSSCIFGSKKEHFPVSTNRSIELYWATPGNIEGMFFNP